MKDFVCIARFFLDTLFARNYTFVSCFKLFRSDWENRQTARRMGPVPKANKAKRLHSQYKANATKGTLSSVPFVALAGSSDRSKKPLPI
jgi:hypothetical protein